MSEAKKFYTRTKEINGTVYTAQFSGLSTSMKAVDQSYIEGSSNTSLEKLYGFILEHVIVDPKVTVEDFDSLSELKAVIDFGSAVMRGEFRDEKQFQTGKGKGEE